MKKKKRRAALKRADDSEPEGPLGPLAGVRVCVFAGESTLVSEDLAAGFRQAGCNVRVFHIATNFRKVGDGTILETQVDGRSPYGAYLFQKIDEFDPSLIVCINGHGFDSYLSLPLIAELKEIPLLNWFVDAPEVSPPYFLDNDARYLVNAAFDRWYADRLLADGHARSFYLPLGVDPEKFIHAKPGAWKPPAPVVFVGTAGLNYIDRTFEQMSVIVQGDPRKVREVVFAEVVRGAEHLERHPETSPMEYIRNEICSRPGNEFYSHPQIMFMVASLIEFQASFQLRARVLNSVTAADVAVVGGKEWGNHLKGPQLLDTIPYKRLAHVYRAAPINLNVTRYQLKTGVNQRVFDVPASGGFLLTDTRPALDEMFVLGEEMVCYRDTAELNAMIRRYLDKPEEREAIARRGRERVLRDHTYARRAEQMFESLASLGVRKGAAGPGKLTDRPLPPKYSARLVCLAQALVREGGRAGAQRVLGRISGWNEPSFDFSALGAELVRGQCSEEALLVLDASLQARPKAGVSVSAGLLALQIGQRGRAADYARKALEIDPADAEAQDLLERATA